MNISHRHHYVPQFLIRQFAAEDGMLFVYDKVSKKINQRSPKASFFAWDRNTVKEGDVELDSLEKLYADLDERHAADVTDVLHFGKIEPEQVTSLLLLASTLKWRTPLSDEVFNQLKVDTTLTDLAVDIRLKDPAVLADPAILQKLLNSNLFRESKRVMLPVLPLLKEDNLLEMHNSSYLYRCRPTPYPALIGDCAILEQAGGAYNELRDFVFPLSSTVSFIYKKGSARTLTDPLQFKLCQDLGTLHFAQQYVGCANRDYLEVLIAQYQVVHAQFRETSTLDDYLLRALFAVV